MNQIEFARATGLVIDEETIQILLQYGLDDAMKIKRFGNARLRALPGMSGQRLKVVLEQLARSGQIEWRKSYAPTLGNSKRNREIYEAKERGDGVRTIAKRYGIGTTRVKEIHAKFKRDLIRAHLSA